LLLFYTPVDRAVAVTIAQSLHDTGYSVQTVRASSQVWRTSPRYDAAIFIVSLFALKDARLRQQMRIARKLGLRCMAFAVAAIETPIQAVPYIDASADLAVGLRELRHLLGPSKKVGVPLRGRLVIGALLVLFIVLPISIGMALGDLTAPEAQLPTLHPFSDPPTSLVVALEATVEVASSATPVPTATGTPSATPTLTATLQPSATPEPTRTATESPTAEPITDEPSATATPTRRATRTPAPTGSRTATLVGDPLEARLTADLITGQVPLVVVFENDSRGEITTYAWDFNGDGRPDSTYARPFPFTYEQPGRYVVTLTVTDNTGQMASQTLEIMVYGSANPLGTTSTLGSTIDGQSEPAQAQFYADTETGEYPLTVVFEDDSWGTIASYAWDFDGDGQVDSSAPEPPPFTYTREGTFTAILRVTGADGRVDEETVMIEVFAPAPPVTRRVAVVRTVPPTPLPVTAQPTATVTPTFTHTPTATVALPTLTFTPTTTFTCTWTPTHTLTPTPTTTPSTTPSATPTSTPTSTPTATVIATLVPTATLVLPQPPPITASFDNGVTDWLASSGWTLTTEAASNGIGSGWKATAGTGSATLIWLTQLDLRTAQNPQASFLSYLLVPSGSTATVTITGSTLTESSTVVPATAGWSTLVIDLSAYRGQIISLSFVWTPVPNSGDLWLIDSLVVQETPPTTVPSATATTEPTPTATSTDTPEPTATATATAEITLPVEITAEATDVTSP